ncbi:MAG: TrmH family RNA methyltransferase [Candidatus Kerfeldbacteria bacterium]
MNEIVIESADNNKIKLLRKLNKKKFRNETSQFFIENMVIINDAEEAGIKFKDLFITEDFLNKNEEWVEKILNTADINEYYIINQKINNSFSNLDTPPGICAIYDKQTNLLDQNDNIIYLNNISDPGNLGTILRSGLAFGIKNFVLDEKCVDLYNYKTIQAAKDSILKVNFSFDNNLKVLNDIKSIMKIYSTGMIEGESIDILKQEEKFCLVLGNESHGVDKEIVDLSNEIVTIGMDGDIESLNVASAAAIFFYGIHKQKK